MCAHLGVVTKEEGRAHVVNHTQEERPLRRRRALSGHPPRVVARIEVCTNNACAKRGGKEVLSALLLLAETNETRARVECRRSRCMDACASACVVRVNGAGGLQRHAHVGADEAGEIFELATGVVVE